MEQYIIANCTDVGRTREVNEDSMVTFDSPNGRVVAVCDGMGGQAAGEVASSLACSIIRDILENNTFDTADQAITAAIQAANQGILHRASMDASLVGMGATCVMVIIRDGMVHYGWVGDSRIYYVANHTIRQISKDQSFVQQLVDRGLLTPEQAENHPQKNEITNALGLEGMSAPEIGKPIAPEKGSVIVLCSDGLSGMVDDAHIERVVSNNQYTLAQRASALVQKANNNGGVDNITVQLIQFTGTTAAAAANTRKGKKFNMSILILAIVTALVCAGAAWFILGNDKPHTSSDDDDDEGMTAVAKDTTERDNNGRQTAGTETPDKKAPEVTVININETAPAPKQQTKTNPKANPQTKPKDQPKDEPKAKDKTKDEPKAKEQTKPNQQTENKDDFKKGEEA